jgi:hypothetical protein
MTAAEAGCGGFRIVLCQHKGINEGKIHCGDRNGSTSCGAFRSKKVSVNKMSRRQYMLCFSEYGPFLEERRGADMQG